MFRRPPAFAVLSGFLLAQSFPSAEFHILAWVALVPLFIALREQTVRSGALLAGITGLTFFCCTLYWTSHALSAYGPFHPIPAALITLALCALLSLYVALFGAVIVQVRKNRPGLLVLAAPAAWVAVELARTHLLTGFPWLLLGYSQYRILPLIQIADITGIYGISFLIVLVNAALATLIEDRKRFFPFLAAVALTGCLVAYGMHRLGQPDGNNSLRVSMVQGNIEQDRKWDAKYQAAVIATYQRLTLAALKEKPDIVVWPETATPFYFGDASSPALTKDLRHFVRSSGTPLLFGSALRETENRRQLLKNAAVFLDEEGRTKGIYTKRRLVPFGEYVPLKNGPLFFLDKLVQPAGEFVPGSEFTVSEVRSASSGVNTPVGAVICYEIIFPGLVRRFVDNGAKVITTITNDAWFGRSTAPYQHFSMAVFRAIENRVPVARAANTGVSGFIDAKGRILDATDIFTEAVRTRTLVPGSTRTFYTCYGDAFAWLCVIAICFLAFPRRL